MNDKKEYKIGNIGYFSPGTKLNLDNSQLNELEKKLSELNGKVNHVNKVNETSYLIEAGARIKSVEEVIEEIKRQHEEQPAGSPVGFNL